MIFICVENVSALYLGRRGWPALLMNWRPEHVRHTVCTIIYYLDSGIGMALGIGDSTYTLA